MVRIRQLSNGIRVVLERMSYFKTAAFGVFVRVGSVNETRENNGISHVIEHMLFQGCRDYPGTAAAAFAGHIAPQEKQERARRVREAVARQQAVFRQAQLALPAMLLAADVSEGQGTRKTAGVRGVNEFYVPCRLLTPVPAMPLSGLVPVRPTGLDAAGLLVEPAGTL